MDKIKNYTIIILFIIIGILLLLRGCGDNIPKNTVIVKDSLVIRVDTVFPLPVTITKVINKPYIVYKEHSNDTTDLSFAKFIVTTKDSLIDSNIAITSINRIQGKPLDLALSYRLKVPKTITKTIEITKTNLKYRQPCYSVFGGMRLGGSTTSLAISPFLALRKDKTYFDISYDVIGKSYNLGVGINLFNIK